MPAAPRGTGLLNQQERGAAGGDRRLTSVLQDQLEESSTSDFEVGEQRERNYRYYTLQEIGNEVKGRSQYVSPDVFDVVESKKAYFKEVFLSARQPIRFSAESDGDQAMADARTSYVRKQLRLNKYPRLMRDAWHDAFVAKRCAVLAEWEEDSKEYTQDIQAAPLQIIQQQLMSDPSIVDIDPSGLEQFIDERSGQPMAQGTVTLTRDTSYVKLKLMEPERYYRDPQVEYVEDGMYMGYEEEIARVTLIDQGFDKDQIENASNDWRYQRAEEDNARKRHDSSWTRRRLHNRTKETETLTVRRHWTYLDLSQYFELGESADDGFNLETLRLWKIYWIDNEVLRKADGSLCIYPAEEIPAFEWTEHKVAHAEHGLATADVVAHTQKTNSTLKRLIIDNQQMRNTTRYEAVIGAVKNPRELLDNNIGGVIWSRSAGSVMPLASPELSPLALGVIEMLDSDKEERSGVSRMAQGLNTDVIRYQNAADMVEKITTNANRRVTQAARDFADNFYIPLAQYIVTLGVRNDTRMHTLEVGGEMQQVSPQQWDETETEMSVHVALTPEESQSYAQSLLMMHQVQSTDPQVQLMYGVKQRHALMDEVYDALGVADSSQFLMKPESPEFAEAMQQQQQQMQKQEQKQDQMMNLQAGAMQSADKREWKKLELDGFREQVNAADKASDNIREDDKFEHDKVVDFAEIDIERKQKRGAAL